jgi:competence ComEA-like helix-hairpin-helix protein
MVSSSSIPLPLRLSFRFLLLALGFVSVQAQTAVLESHAKARWVDAPYNDGDSFLVAFAGTNHVIRLYYVDCPESQAGDESDQRRILEQKRYFGIAEGPEMQRMGKEAALRTRTLLKGRPFTLHTALARAPGRSGKPRIYGMITLEDGRDLAQVLVDEGLARNSGTRRGTPTGVSAEEYAAFLGDRELVAALGRKGCWALTDATRLAQMRGEQRADESKLQLEALGVAGIVSEDRPLNLNEATMEELQLLRGIGPALAERIVQNRPFRTVEDLDRVPGIGPDSLDKWRPFLTVGSAPKPKP